MIQIAVLAKHQVLKQGMTVKICSGTVSVRIVLKTSDIGESDEPFTTWAEDIIRVKVLDTDDALHNGCENMSYTIKHQKSSKREICHILKGIVMYLLTIFPSPPT